jgi:hypothetical protein
LNTAAAWQATGSAVLAALAHADRPESLALLAQGLHELAPFADMRGAEPQLLSALRSGQVEPVLLTRALLALHSNELAAGLLERLRAADETSAAPLLNALELALRAGVGAQAAGPVLTGRLATTSPTLRPRLMGLLTLARTDGPWRASASASSSELQALADLLGSLPATSERREQLLGLLAAKNTVVREHAALALARSADAATLQALFGRLTRPAATHESLLLHALAGALLSMNGGAGLPTQLRTTLFDRISGVDLLSPQPEIAASALIALRAFADPRTALRIAQLLRTGSASLRSAALLALGDFELKDTRRLLRSALQNESPRNLVNAAVALAEVGTEHDAEALARVAEHGTWPLPAAATYAVARIAQRGVTKKHTLERVLCRMGRLPNVYVRANVAAGLAALAAPTCDGQIAPQHWLDASMPSALRTAAAYWLRASNGAERAAPLAQCANDPDPSVARACRDELPSRTPRQELLLQALAGDSSKPQRERMVALRFADGSVFIGPSDANGQLLLRHAPVGPIELEDPADAEPMPASRPVPPRTSSLSSAAIWAEGLSRVPQIAAAASTR